MSADWKKPTSDITWLLDTIISEVPPPETREGTVQMKITSLEYSSYVGRMAIGRVSRGKVVSGQPVSLVKRDQSVNKGKVKELFVFEGLNKKKVDEVPCGDLCAISGLEGFDISDTVADFENPEGLPPIPIDEPTMSMLFTINDSPFFGKEGKYVTSRHLRDRLFLETEKNLALKVKETDSPDSYMVYGRGILHLAILVETMRREGFELQLGKPRVIIKEMEGKKCEPIEILTIDTPESASGKVIEFVSQRKGELLVMEPKHDLIHLEFEIPARGLIGFRTQVMNLTAGEAIIASHFKGFEPLKGEISQRINGTLVAMETGSAIAYAINKLQDRGEFFVKPGDDIYGGQIVGENTRTGDIVVNLTKTKKLTNMRASGSDEKVRIAPPVEFSLEEAMEYIQDDEYVEVTPKSIRLRKILLQEHERKRMSNLMSVM
jgi:GTP-binding protein